MGVKERLSSDWSFKISFKFREFSLGRLGGDSRVSVRMDSQEQEIAEAAVIGGDCRFGGVYFEKFVYGSGEG